MSTSTTLAEPVKTCALDDFRKLFNKYAEGRQWLMQQEFRGRDISQDLDDFSVRVIVPIQKLWFSLAEQERDALRHELCSDLFDERVLPGAVCARVGRGAGRE